jgi:NAD(P)-dependent dehydrogenase (short-subunit alcohol dehydrogenase family)
VDLALNGRKAIITGAAKGIGFATATLLAAVRACEAATPHLKQSPQAKQGAAAILASPRSAFTVGQNLHMDGGYMQHVAF